MSERLSSVEIEDVLSSIRRLVSEDLRPGAKPAAVAAEAPSRPPVVDPAGADKLILTPALRIGPEPETEAEAAVAEVLPEAEATVLPSFQSIRQARGGSVVDRVTRALPEEDWEPVAEAVEPRSDWATEAEAAVEAAGAVWSEAPVAPVAQPADPVLEAQVPEAAAVMDEPEVAALDMPAAQASEADLPEPEGAEVVAAEGWPASDAPDANWAAPGEPAPMEAEPPEDPGWSAVEPMAIDRPSAEIVERDPAGEEVRTMPHPQDPTDLGGGLPSDLPDWARMEADAEQAVAPDPLSPEEPVAAPSAAARAADAGWADAAEAQIRRELEEEDGATVFARFEDDDHDDRHFDEEMLRDLVRDIIREELQGALGERITRNVRKLVRAEIARALAVRDFE